ncbi:hypothetical protein LP085_03640 [Achromobacter sp. MY14]|uniref:hypothetical protein n=1 Tax=unclassified Achromobacter TaxID=2626865 RepID=UPI001E51B153|nr:hypothetical protein [Achromobacter sp. MY14]MCD0495936.1 hypothetical protein [Achromobacter sp. MY14]
MNIAKPKPSFKAFYLALSSDDRAKFASRACTTVAYIETHLLYARKVPRKGTMDALWKASQEFGAPFDHGELLGFFYGGPKPHEPLAPTSP